MIRLSSTCPGGPHSPRCLATAFGTRYTAAEIAFLCPGSYPFLEPQLIMEGCGSDNQGARQGLPGSALLAQGGGWGELWYLLSG